MATKVIWFSTKNDDPTRFKETLTKADEVCDKKKIGFNQLVNLALRAYLKMPKVKVAKSG